MAVLPEPTRAGDPGDPADPAGSHADRDALWSALAALPRQQRAVLVLRHYEDMADTEIADVLGCAPSTVRVHASRAAAALRARLGEPAPDPATNTGGHHGRPR
jgi:RNA polymerase sigma factor (sigma-70 family)